MSTACSKASTSNVPSSLRNFMRFSDARLQAESSTCMYSGTRIARVDPPAVRARVPVVDDRVVLDARVGAAPGGFRDLAHELARRDGLTHRTARDPRGRLPDGVVLDGLHECVVDANRVVRVLVLDREEAVAVDRHVEPGVAQRGGLVLLLGLAPDELADVRVVDVEHDHLRCAARLAARLDRAGPRVGAAHEGDRAGGRAALLQRLHRPADPGEVDAGARTAAEDIALARVPVEDRLHRVLDAEDKARTALWCIFESHVEPDGAVERRQLVEQDEGQLGFEAVGVLGAREVAAVAAPLRDRAGDTTDHLLDRPLALGRADLPAEVLLGDDVGRVL